MLFLVLITTTLAALPITQENAEDFMSGDDYSFLAFSLPKDYHSLEKKLDKMHDKFPQVKFGIINSTLNGELEEKYGVYYYPSFILYRPNYQKRYYYDSWDTSTIYEFIEEGMTPILEEVNEQHLTKLKSILNGEKKEEKKNKKQKKQHNFFLMIADNKTDNSMIEEYTRITDELSLTIDSKFYIANGEFNLYYYSKDGTQQWDQKYPLSWWMNIVCFPLFDVLSDDSADILEFEHNLPVFWYFSNNSDTSRDQIKQLAQQYRYQMLFVEVSSSDIEIDSYGQQIAPSATIIHPNGRTIYPLPTIDAIEQDIKRFFNNEFQPLVRSSSEQEVIAGIVAPQLLRSSWDETLEANPNIIIFVVDSSPYGISLLQRDIAAFMNRTIATTSFKTYWMNGDTDDVPVEVEFSSIPALLVWKDNQFKVFEGEFKQKNLVEFVSKFFEFNPGEEIPEDALPVLIEDDDDIDEGELSDDESDNGIDEEQLQRSSNKEQETLTVKQIQEILKDPFVKKTLKEIKWTKIFDVPKNFNVNNVKQVQQLAKDDTFIELLSPFYKEVHSMKQENKPKKVKKQRDEL